MKRNLHWLIYMFPLLLVSCGTPPEIKQLSVKQIEYIGIANEVINIQSRALIRGKLGKAGVTSDYFTFDIGLFPSEMGSILYL